jgi:hypothetical protein
MHFYHFAVIFIHLALAETTFYSCVGYGRVFGEIIDDFKSDLGTIKDLAIFKDALSWQPDSRVTMLSSKDQFM